MFRRVAALGLCLFVISSVSAFAGDSEKNEGTPAAPIKLWTAPPADKRPVALSAMYATYGTLQVLDFVSTRKAMGAGAYEANPLMATGTKGQMIAVKAVTGAMSIYFAEKAWRKNKVGAIVMMVATNAATTAIVARNMRNAKR